MATKKKIAMAPISNRQTVSIATLEGLGACEPQKDIFERAFNVFNRIERVKITVKNIRKAEDQGLNVGWLIFKVLDRKAFNSFQAKRRGLYQRRVHMRITDEEMHQKLQELEAQYLREYWAK